MSREFTAATYNVHNWAGKDGRRDPQLVLKVIQCLRAGVLALQEVSLSAPGMSGFGLDDLARKTGMKAIPGPTLLRKDTGFGNVLLTAYPVYGIENIDLSVSDYEPRGAIRATLDIHGLPVRVTATHLGLKHHERAEQVLRLSEITDTGSPDPLLLLGDLNEWNPLGKSLRRLRSQLGLQPAPFNYPSRFPILALDRILVHPKELVTEIRVIKTPLTQRASDHLPVKAVIDLDQGKSV